MTTTKERRKELESRGGDIRRKALQENRKLTDAEAAEIREIENELDREEFDHKSCSEGRKSREVRVYKRAEKMVQANTGGLGARIRGVVDVYWREPRSCAPWRRAPAPPAATLIERVKR
jgi:hypothetical protein